MSNEPAATKAYCLINAYEGAVFTTVRGLINKDPEMCKCEKCFLDVCAIVMNKGFFHIVTTEQGELLARLSELEESRSIDLLVTAIEAIKLVKARPNH